MNASRHSNVLLHDGPVVRVNINSVSQDVDDVQELIKIVRDKLHDVDRVLARKVGVAIVYLITCEQIQGGIEPTHQNISRELDQYYFSLPDNEVSLNLQNGIDESVEIVRKLNISGEIERLKEELRKLVS